MIKYKRLFIRHMQKGKVVLRLKNFSVKADAKENLQMAMLLRVTAFTQ